MLFKFLFVFFFFVCLQNVNFGIFIIEIEIFFFFFLQIFFLFFGLNVTCQNELRDITFVASPSRIRKHFRVFVLPVLPKPFSNEENQSI